MNIVNNISELYVMKRHTSAIYADCAIVAKSYAEALYDHFCRISDQDRHHAQAFYGFMIELDPKGPVHAVHAALPIFTAFGPKDGADPDEATVQGAAACLQDAARAEKFFYERADKIITTGGYGEFEQRLSLRGLVQTSYRREGEFMQLLRLVRDDIFHGQKEPHECLYCGAMVEVWSEECPVCHETFSYQEKVSGYLVRRGEKLR